MGKVGRSSRSTERTPAAKKRLSDKPLATSHRARCAPSSISVDAPPAAGSQRDAQEIPDRTGVLHDFVGCTVPLRGRERHLFSCLSIRSDRNRPRHARAGLRMPHDHLIGPRWDMVNLERALVVRHCIIGIVDGHGPAFHVGVKSTLHVKRSPALVQIDRADQGLARRMIMNGVNVASAVLD